MFDFATSMPIKVCGLTSVEDARGCAEAGVEMLGLNFSPRSLRCVSESAAQKIADNVRAESSAKLIGIFLDQPADFVERIARELPLDAVQLHGNESPWYVQNLRAPNVIKALRVRGEVSSAENYDCAAILLDAWDATSPGGAGKTFPWEFAARFPRDRCRLILAGGLTSDNVAEAIRIVRPWAVDVCSGVEDSPGKKSREKIQRFVQACR